MESFLLHLFKEMRFLFKALFLFYSSGIGAETLILSAGEKTFIPAPGDQKVRIGDKSLLQLQQQGEQLSLLARKRGQTLLITGPKKYQVFIFEAKTKIKALYLDRLLKNLWGLNWSFSENNIFQISGELYRFSDWLDLVQAFKKQNIQYEFKAQMDEELKKISSYYLKQNLKQPFEVLWQDLPFVLVPQSSALNEYQEILQTFGLRVKEEEHWFFKAPWIEIEIAVFENLSSSVFSAGGESDKSLSDFSSLLALLNFLKSSGHGKSLHHSSLITQSGKKIQLESGGQIPFSSYNLKTEQKSIDWKSHGLQLTLTPQVGKKNQIHIQLLARMSEPLSFASADSPPPLKTQSLETEMLLEDGQIIKLFDLKKKSKGTHYRGGLGFLLESSSFLLGGQNRYNMTQSVFIQLKIVKESSNKKLQEFL